MEGSHLGAAEDVTAVGSEACLERHALLIGMARVRAREQARVGVDEVDGALGGREQHPHA